MAMCKCLAVLAVLCNPLVMFTQTKRSAGSAAASPGAVCAFITGRMDSAIPQVPTLCSGGYRRFGQYVSGDLLVIDLFATKDVFQTSMRRAWSSALFQTLQALSAERTLKDACFEASECIFNISDSTMAENQLRYKLILDQNMMSVLMGRGSNFSESWYETWWSFLMAVKADDHPGSKENAEWLGKDACDTYRKESGPTFRALGQPIPACSVMLATDKALVLVIDFSDSMFVNGPSDEHLLTQTVGKVLDQTGYKGSVVIRTPWNKRNDGSQSRTYQVYDLDGLEFAYEEFHSGTRSEGSAGFLFSSGPYRLAIGQTDLDKPLDTLNDAAPLYIIKESPSPDGARFIDTSDGAEWQVSANSMTRCPFAVGDSVNLMKTKELIMFGYLDPGTNACQIDVSFVKGW